MNIAEMLGDTLSQKNYEFLKEYRESKSYRAIGKMGLLAYESKNGISFEESVKKQGNRKKVLFGTGAIAEEMVLFFREIGLDFDFFYSNGKNESSFKGISLLSLDVVKGNPEDYCFFIGTSIPTYIQEIKEQLTLLGVAEGQIAFACGDLGRQYYDMPEIVFTQEEVFVDAGCFNGDDVRSFAEATQGKYKKIYAFEPDGTNYKNCVARLAHLENVEVVNSGLWHEKASLSFSQLSTGSSHVSEEEGEKVDLCALDELLNGEKITYLKMDIEGAELSALKGAAETIKKHRPKLAICVYHKEDDMIEIPEYIASLRPDYKFYVRHYSLGQLESVLYAL